MVAAVPCVQRPGGKTSTRASMCSMIRGPMCSGTAAPLFNTLHLWLQPPSGETALAGVMSTMISGPMSSGDFPKAYVGAHNLSTVLRQVLFEQQERRSHCLAADVSAFNARAGGRCGTPACTHIWGGREAGAMIWSRLLTLSCSFYGAGYRGRATK